MDAECYPELDLHNCHRFLRRMRCCICGGKKLHYRIQGMDSILMTGVVVLSVYAQMFSLFYKVGALANSILLAACIVILFFFAGISRSALEYGGGRPLSSKSCCLLFSFCCGHIIHLGARCILTRICITHNVFDG